MKKFYFLSGLPRTGSTLLSSILAQNPNIHSEGNSAVCQLMWDMQISCSINSIEAILASRKYDLQNDLVKEIPNIYYKDVKSKYILDKCRTWTYPDNVSMIKRYITPNPKIIVLTRPIEEIVKSFVDLRKKSGWTNNFEYGLLDQNTDPIMRPLAGIQYAKNDKDTDYLFIEYEDLVDSTQDILNSIYDFCEWEPYKHDLSNIVDRNIEDDSVYGLVDLHKVRSKIEKRIY